jgi:hypothetical protein
MPEIIDRKTAIARGLTKYFTGKPCSHGHLSERYCKNGACQRCLSPNSTGLVRLQPAAIEGQIVSGPDDRLELMKEKLAIDRINAEANARLIELRAQSLALRSNLSNERTERRADREKRKFLKEHLVPVNILGFDEDYHVAVNMVWMAAMMRNPEITKADVLTGRKNEFGYYIMRCFPEDKVMLCEQTNRLYSQKRTDDVIRLREQAIASAQVAEAAEIESEWPEFRP